MKVTVVRESAPPPPIKEIQISLSPVQANTLLAFLEQHLKKYPLNGEPDWPTAFRLAKQLKELFA